MTASELEGSSPALRAQDQSFAHELRSRANALDGIADGLWSTNKIRADQVRFIASALQWIATQLITRHEPRGLSASEQPCCEAVINNPVDPTPGESE